MSSKIDRMDEVKIPFWEENFLSRDPERVRDGIRVIVKYLQETLDKIIRSSNLLIDLADGEAWYSDLKNSAGEYPNDTWRIIRVGDNLERQVKISDVWTQTGIWERPI